MLRAWRGRQLRGPLQPALLAVQDRDERVPGHAARREAARAADGPRAVRRRRWSRCCVPGRPRTTGSPPSRTPSVLPEHGDPAEIAALRDSVRLAFVTALQHLPARQRAALILCEVLRLPGGRGGGDARSSVASVNSALQRARATLAELPDEQRPAEVDPENARAARAVRGCLPALRHEGAARAHPRGRGHDDAAFRVVGPRRRRHHRRGWCSRRRASARARSSCRCRPTACRPGASTSPTRQAATSRGGCRCTRSAAASSAGSPGSSTRRRLFPLFGLPPHWINAQLSGVTRRPEQLERVRDTARRVRAARRGARGGRAAVPGRRDARGEAGDAGRTRSSGSRR